jgi:hypothetical protein
LVPLFLGKNCLFSTPFVKTPSLIRVENIRFYLTKEGPTLKPSSLKLGTCQGQHSFTLALPNSISKPTCSNVCGLPLSNVMSISTVWLLCHNLINIIWFKYSIIVKWLPILATLVVSFSLVPQLCTMHYASNYTTNDI